MTPSARIAAAIEILDRIGSGAPAEKALTNWARASRFAGSGDRAAIRDHVFTALRCWRSHAALGGAETGRGRMLGQLREAGQDPEAFFTGATHSPAPLTEAEHAHLGADVAMPQAVALDCPDWLMPALEASLGADFEPVMAALRHRAPVWLRVNALRADRDGALASLTADGIVARPHPNVKMALEVTENERKIRNSSAYRDGLVELQDLASQAVVDLLPVPSEGRILDYCAGGGGKALALAARAPGAAIDAHDADPARMVDLPARAARAAASIRPIEPGTANRHGPYDVVLCDVPCSGSGAWRRSPEAKWRLNPEGLERLLDAQRGILAEAAALVAPGGRLAYVTCSLLDAENSKQIQTFTSQYSAWEQLLAQRFLPTQEGDGFYCCVLTRVGHGS
ncbi:SAM-dependent methyltransferase [Maritimibacter sp. 55A14]|uniref:RsmB/NOP family class I SAM-dependent RNA methyltransferase n=1 Tax=Maritimibacter sp. 55A14 TaxID=2174844 RepID=UPI000D60A823|nr:RsmB/NOP family class I SAM-dependent RNA methyltransferase [Maritimibacter sp. 55A14]PWE34201.1 SAM-dependent methyltransferase [Maritimibacter sp. 55A14]